MNMTVTTVSLNGANQYVALQAGDVAGEIPTDGYTRQEYPGKPS
ncbi:hypothetical protein [Paenibacillus prosopidis]|uniref:Uncharacterized protein n=1 Tax=Paenibacillus prosopidis TaxID=630520 RepID=A0A368W1M5_9BACL|nr:hypothetical protein [Paenibacillus prosopidis]RCW48501.1 hypothetical protein DFP97_106201 [Paenibacillus prosopidis]